MMGWGVAAVLMIERGLSWWQVALVVAGGNVIEFMGRAFADGIKRGREELDERRDAPDRGRAAAEG